MKTGRTERDAFAYWLRTGFKLLDDDSTAPLPEHKFNPWHDPDDGRFTFANQGRYFGRGSRSNRSQPSGAPIRPTPRPTSRSTPRPTPRSTPGPTPRSTPGPTPSPTPSGVRTRQVRPVPLGSLSEKHEASGRGAGTISTGKGDPGGVSYGSYQLSSQKGTLAAFLDSPEFRPWARKFDKLAPVTPGFDRQWRAEAERDPDAFRDAQRAFIMRTHYMPILGRVARSTGLNLEGARRAVRQAAFSVSVQHGGAATILSDAVRRADKRFRRDDKRYQRALIEAIYDRRSEYVGVLRDRARADRKLDDANTFNNLITIRYPRERADALRMLGD